MIKPMMASVRAHVGRRKVHAKATMEMNNPT